MCNAEVHPLRPQPQRPFVEYAEPAIALRDVSVRVESRFDRMRLWGEPMCNALLRHTIPPTRLPSRHVRYALQRINLSIFPGEIVALTGERGAGKTTLLKLLAGRIKPSSGSIHLRGSSALADVSEAQANPRTDIVLIDVPPAGDMNLSAYGELVSHCRQRDAVLVFASPDARAIVALCSRVLHLHHGLLIADDEIHESAQRSDMMPRAPICSAISPTATPI